jgi:hypothetical protein
MTIRTILLFAVLATILALRAIAHSAVPMLTAMVPGGPPSVHLAGKHGGTILPTDLAKTATLGLHGCVPDVRITSFTIAIMDCDQKRFTLTAKGPELTAEMCSMLLNLPPKSTFTISAEVVDASGKAWPVEPATFRWKG